MVERAVRATRVRARRLVSGRMGRVNIAVEENEEAKVGATLTFLESSRVDSVTLQSLAGAQILTYMNAPEPALLPSMVA